MNFQDALTKADQILDQERRFPTVEYVPTKMPNPSGHPLADAMGTINDAFAIGELNKARSEHPRKILDNGQKFSFKSVNYQMLCALAARLVEIERPLFISSVLSRIVIAPACGPAKTAAYPSWNGVTSELPLVVEFAIRNHSAGNLFRSIAEALPLPGHVILLRHLEEMISLNFTLITDAEYEHLALSIKAFGDGTHERLERYYQGDVRIAGWGELKQEGILTIFRELQSSAEVIITQCHTARYLYLKGSLLEGLNLEVNHDKEVVESYLIQLGFSKTLLEGLNVAEQSYRSSGTKFEFKNCIGLLRSFLENLHKQVIQALILRDGGNVPPNWGTGLAFLRQKGVLTGAEEVFASGLFKLMSDEAVHPLIAEREYARLARNMVIEYGLLLLRKMEKAGVRISTVPKTVSAK
jgi:hypothetical protein